MLFSLLLMLFTNPLTEPRSFTVETIDHASPVMRAMPYGLNYANTSAKEEYGDAPWVTRNGQIPMVFVVKDANDNEMCFTYLRLYRNVGASRTLLAEDNAARMISSDQTFWTIDLTTALFGATVGDTVLFEWELQFSDALCTQSHLNHYFNRVAVGAPLPNLAGWYRVDTHYHSELTDNIFEFGGHLVTVARAAQAVGLQAVCLTDHSTDILPAEWDTLAARAARFSTGSFRFIPGTELTVDSDESNQTPDNRIHLLAIGLTRALPAPEECCTDNSSGQLWTLRRGLDSIAVQSGVAFAAHPSSNYSVGFGGNLAVWSTANWDAALDYPVFIGSEFFNERRTVFPNTSVTEDYIYPYGWQTNTAWESTWQGGLGQYLGLLQTHLEPLRPLALAGGSDAHGDLSYKTTNQYGTIQLAANDDGIGKVHTLVYAPVGLSQPNIINGLRLGSTVMSDGPALAVTVDRDGNGTSEGTVGGMFALLPAAQLHIVATSLNEFGTFTSGRILRVTPTSLDTITFGVAGFNVNTTVPAYALAEPGHWSAVLVEIRTSAGYRAMSSPVYLAPQGTTGVGPDHAELALSQPRPDPVVGLMTCSYSLPTAVHASLSIYDVQGRRLATLVEGQQEGGTHRTTWSPGATRAGVYYLRLQVPGRQLNRKFVLLR
ncbi:MAG: T9SS type A sorting domain-containing protein [Candidatus Kerfeldbacteria bacterium]|nr:T9SS type A sorting domain-containing protein [Candidatus Kerfeldbacteria bacterium]